jgi:hypothetical protein
MSRIKSERDYLSFEEIQDQVWARRVKSIGTSLLAGFEFDSIQASYPDSVTEVYTYKVGGLSGNVVATITVIYTNSSKSDILSVVRT